MISAAACCHSREDDKPGIRSCRVASTIPAVLSVLLVTFPFFSLVLAGYGAARRRMLPFEAIGGLNSFVLFLRAALHAVPLSCQHAIAQILEPDRGDALAGVLPLPRLGRLEP